MNEQNKKLIISEIIYFFVFLLMPAFIFGSGFFVKDIGLFYEYLIKVYPFLSIIFVVLVLRILGYTKKIFFGFMGLLIVSYIFSAFFLYVRIGMLFADSNIFSF